MNGLALQPPLEEAFRRFRSEHGQFERAIEELFEDLEQLRHQLEGKLTELEAERSSLADQRRQLEAREGELVGELRALRSLLERQGTSAGGSETTSSGRNKKS